MELMLNHPRWRFLPRACLPVLVFLLLSGCASMNTADPRDPFEAANRSVYSFNELIGLDLHDEMSGNE